MIVCFADINIDRIVDYHCLNFLFIIMKRNKKLKVRKIDNLIHVTHFLPKLQYYVFMFIMTDKGLIQVFKLVEGHI